jgi:hypothetical protein
MKIFTLTAAIVVSTSLIHATNGFLSSTRTEVCGDPSDNCMNEENWSRCIDLVAECRNSVKVLDSTCPWKFACDEDDLFEQHPLEQTPSACASLLVYKDKKCHGDPIRSLTFPTWTHPGSLCCKYSITSLIFDCGWHFPIQFSSQFSNRIDCDIVNEIRS